MNWITIKQVMGKLNISRQTVYVLAKQFEWKTKTVGSTRLYFLADVANTPNAEQRKRSGYVKRSQNTAQTVQDSP